MTYRIIQADCLEELANLDPIDAVVTDPPYGLTANKKGGTGEASLNLNSPAGRSRISTGGGFMGQKWDAGVPGVEFWQAIGAAMKPGAHLLAFGGTRTFHRLACAIEDSGFEIRDCIMWVYGTGFPKSHDVSKAIDRAASSSDPKAPTVSAPATDAAKQWDGWGTALKPAWEPIIVARKPFDGTVAENVQRHGTGALNIDGCRVATSDGYSENAVTQGVNTARTSWEPRQVRRTFEPSRSGRWPANLIHDGSDEVVGLFPESKSCNSPSSARSTSIYRPGMGAYQGQGPLYPGDSGSAARFFYCAKANKKERGEGNDHPTVKPLALMRYLCRLVTPPGGVILDPFMGSGSTLVAAKAEGFRSIGIDLEPHYCKIAERRLGNK